MGESTVPHESEADLESRRVVLKINDDREDEGGDEVGQGDNNGGQVLVDEIHNEIHLHQSGKSVTGSISE